MRPREFQQGMALVSALLLLVVTTVLALAMFRSFGVLEHIAGNTREKQRAFHAAESARTYAEAWLSGAAGVNATTGSACAAGPSTTPLICTAALTNVTNPSTWPTWVSHTPPGMSTGNTGAVGNYASVPSFYISYLTNTYSGKTGTQTFYYQIDSAGYAGTTSSAVVTEATYAVGITYTSADSLKKFINLGGP